MPGEAERFYARIDLAYRQRTLSQGKSPEQVLREIGQPRHRYFCVAEYLMTHPGQSTIELGFGSAEIAVALSGMVAQYRIVDIVPRHGGADLPANVSFTKADLNDDFPFGNGEFDCTIAMMVVEHLFDPFHSFREIARITKPGGKIFINVPNIASIRCRLQLAFGRMPVTSANDWFEREEWDGNHLHYFTLRDTVRLARHVRLKLDAYSPVGDRLWLKRLAPTLLCHEISFSFSKPDVSG